MPLDPWSQACGLASTWQPPGAVLPPPHNIPLDSTLLCPPETFFPSFPPVEPRRRLSLLPLLLFTPLVQGTAQLSFFEREKTLFNRRTLFNSGPFAESLQRPLSFLLRRERTQLPIGEFLASLTASCARTDLACPRIPSPILTCLAWGSDSKPRDDVQQLQ